IADDRLLIPDPAVSRSTTSTSPAPRRLRWNATEAPATPAPTTITSALIWCLLHAAEVVEDGPPARSRGAAPIGYPGRYAAAGWSRGGPPPGLPVPAQVGQDAVGRVVAGRPGHAAPRVGTRAAQVQAPDRGGVPGPARYRPHVEQLAGRDVTVEDVALGQPVVALQGHRGAHLAGQHRRGHARRELRDPDQDPVAELAPPPLPGPLGQPVRHVLYEAGHD